MASEPYFQFVSGLPSAQLPLAGVEPLAIIQLGASVKVTAANLAANGINIGVTPIISGISDRLLYDSSGKAGIASVGSGLSFSGGILSATGSAGGDPLSLTQGLGVNTTNPSFAGGTGFATGINLNVTYSGQPITDPDFSDENGLSLNLNAASGQFAYGNALTGVFTTAKKTFIAGDFTTTAAGAGQRFAATFGLNSYGMGDAFLFSGQGTYAGGPGSGDEGQGLSASMHFGQQNRLCMATITSVTRSGLVAGVVITQPVFANVAAQTVTVSSTTGLANGDWLCIGQYVDPSPSVEEVQVIGFAVGTITAIFTSNHGQTFTGRIDNGTPGIAGTTLTVTAPNCQIIASTIRGVTITGSGVASGTVVLNQLTGSPGGAGTYTVNNSQLVASETMVTAETVQPALVLGLGGNGTFQMGEGRYLIDRSGLTVNAGTVSAIAGGGFTGQGTSWSDTMVGGNSLNVGAISLDADTQTASPFGGSFPNTDGPLHSWYRIFGGTTSTGLGIVSYSVAGDQSYRGCGTTSVTGSISGTTFTVTLIGSQPGYIVPGMTITSNGSVSAGTRITSQLTSTEPGGRLGGRGTYQINNSQTVGVTTYHCTGGTYIIQPSAMVYRVTSGTEVVCEAAPVNVSNWQIGHTVEQAITPYPDVHGWQWPFFCYTPGATMRSFIGITNEGTRMLGGGISLGGFMPTGGNADIYAFGIGLEIDSCLTGIVLTPRDTAISLPSNGAFGSGNSDNGGLIRWGNLATYIVPDTAIYNGNANLGMIFSMSGQGRGGVIRSVSSGVNLAGDRSELLITGYLQLASDSSHHNTWLRLGGSETPGDPVTFPIMDIKINDVGSPVTPNSPTIDFIFTIGGPVSYYPLSFSQSLIETTPIGQTTPVSNVTNLSSIPFYNYTSVWNGSSAQLRQFGCKLSPAAASTMHC